MQGAGEKPRVYVHGQEGESNNPHCVLQDDDWNDCHTEDRSSPDSAKNEMTRNQTGDQKIHT